MTANAAAASAGPVDPPSARAMRRALRRARRRSGAAKPLGETLQDLYVTLFAVVMVVVVAGPTAERVLRDVEHRSASTALASSLVAAALLAAAGAVLSALLLVGPVVRDPADVTWLLSSPVRRRGLLARPALLLLGAGAVVGGVVTLGASVLVPGAATLVWGLSGAVGGLLAVALAVVVQSRRRLQRLMRLASTALTAAALVVLVVGLAAGDQLGWSLHVGLVVLAAITTAAVATLALLPSALDRLRRQEITAGAGLALGLRATVTTLDGSFVAETMRARRLLGHGIVRRRPLAAHGLLAVLVADVRRALRSPRALMVPLALVPIAWLVARLYGSVAATIAVVLVGWAAAGSASAGLRTVSRSRALARSLPFSDVDLRAAHLGVPGVVAAVVTSVAAAVCDRPAWIAAPATACALAGVLRTSAGRAPVKWELQAESPMGAMPVGAVMSYAVGIDVVALTSVPLLVQLDPFVCVAVPAAVGLLLLRQRRRAE